MNTHQTFFKVDHTIEGRTNLRHLLSSWKHWASARSG
jgi:hypothetical protein